MTRRSFVVALLALVALLAPAVACAQSVLVPAGAVWRYLDNGSNQGTAWRAPTFADGAWASGPAPLGYGDGDEATVVGYGPSASNKYITTYFRHAFTVANPTSFTGLTLRLVRDDGAVVYLNGVEVFRSNMPSGTIGYRTLASTAVSGSAENTFVSTTLSASALVAGTNVLAVEVHQNAASSTDLSFNLELTGGTGAPTVTRGPYLQLGTPTEVTVRWRTSFASGTRVVYGTDPASLTAFVDGAPSTTEHEVRLTGLVPDTRYYYAVGTPTAVLAGGDLTHFFVTAPSLGTPKPTRIWVLGDSGTADANARAVRDAYLAFTGTRHTDLWLMLGDNAYEDGTDAEYQAAVFNMYPTMLRKSVLWPTYGNHDGQSASSASQTGPYYDIFTLPTQGQAGGVPSGTEAYYSFDYGNIHFISLESFETDRSATGPMMTWLQNDLASTTQPWIIAFWHHPPYSRGSHDSDVDIEEIQMRQNALPILEAAGVDLVLSGHSHSYERSFLIDGHYGPSTSLMPSMIVDGGSGREDGSGAYRKPAVVRAPREGAVYAVAGSSGDTAGGRLNHPVMFVSLNTLGSVILDISGDRLDLRFLDSTGATRDYFTMLKTSAPVPDTTPPVLSGGQPSGTLVSGTTLVALTLSTSESAACRYSTVAGTQYAAMTSVFTATGSMSHSTLVSSLVDGGSYAYYVRCQDPAGNPTTSDYTIAFTIATPPLDTVPPVRSNGQPAGPLATGTTQTSLTLATNEAASCRYSTTAGIAFTAMTNVFATTGSLAHATPVTGLANGVSYTYYVRCQDGAGNFNTNDFLISFSVAGTAPAGLLAAYSFNQGSGTSAPDASGNGNTGTITNGTWTAAGQLGGALTFNGSSSRVRGPSITLPAAFTLMAWIFNPTAAAFETVVTIGSPRDLYLGSGVLTFWDGTADRAFGPALVANTWHHVALVSDGTTLRAYRNGAPHGTTLSVSLGSAAGVIQIGAWIQGSSNVDFFGGTIDEVRIYNRALTQAEIQSLMTLPISP